MNVTTKRLDALKHPKINVRIHSEQQIRELKRSVENFGQTRAIVVDEDDTILIGNGLYEAMVSLGYQEATVYVKTGLSENDKKKLMIADNKTYALKHFYMFESFFYVMDFHLPCVRFFSYFSNVEQSEEKLL